MLTDMGLFKKSDLGSGQVSAVRKMLPDVTNQEEDHSQQKDASQTGSIEQPTLSDFGLKIARFAVSL
jgi:hypothetical protein